MSDCGEIKFESKTEKIVVITISIIMLIIMGTSFIISAISLVMLLMGYSLEIYQAVSFVFTGIFMLFLISVSWGKRSA